MSVRQPCSNSQIHALISLPQPTNTSLSLMEMQQPPQQDSFDYSQRSQWLRAAVLGANDGLISVSSLMIGVGAVNQTAKAMFISGLAGLVAGACSMAIGEYTSVHSQLDIELSQITREKRVASDKELADLPKPTQAAGASALAFAAGAVLPLMTGGFIQHRWARFGVVCGVSSLGLAGFGVAGAILGGSPVRKSAVRILIGGWTAMVLSYGVLKIFGLAVGTQGLS